MAYHTIRNVLDGEFLKTVQLLTIHELNTAQPVLDTQMKNRHSLGRSVLGDTLLYSLKPVFENTIGTKLLPSYSYLSMYRRGSNLAKHRDRQCCEWTASITVKNLGEKIWPLWLEYQGKDVSVDLNEGDALLFQGHQHPHWRVPDLECANVSVFLHYVVDGGEYVDFWEHEVSCNKVALKKDPSVLQFANEELE